MNMFRLHRFNAQLMHQIIEACSICCNI